MTRLRWIGLTAVSLYLVSLFLSCLAFIDDLSFFSGRELEKLKYNVDKLDQKISDYERSDNAWTLEKNIKDKKENSECMI